jgi:hypothetical protein
VRSDPEQLADILDAAEKIAAKVCEGHAAFVQGRVRPACARSLADATPLNYSGL